MTQWSSPFFRSVIVAGTGIDITWDPTPYPGTLTFDVTGGGGDDLTQEEVEDIVASLIDDSDEIEWEYNDGTPFLKAHLIDNSIVLARLVITGTPNGTKFLRDDGSWQRVTTTISAGTSVTLMSGEVVRIVVDDSNPLNTILNLVLGLGDDNMIVGALDSAYLNYTGTPLAVVAGGTLFASTDVDWDDPISTAWGTSIGGIGGTIEILESGLYLHQVSVSIGSIDDADHGTFCRVSSWDFTSFGMLRDNGGGGTDVYMSTSAETLWREIGDVLVPECIIQAFEADLVVSGITVSITQIAVNA